MRGLLHVLSVMAVIGLGFWAYQENYKTQAALRDVRGLNAQIGAAHARVNVLNAEWAYLNRPDRLRDLVELNFDRLGLLPLTPEAFSRADRVSYPLPDILPLGNVIDPVDVSTAAMEEMLNGEDPL